MNHPARERRLANVMRLIYSEPRVFWVLSPVWKKRASSVATGPSSALSMRTPSPRPVPSPSHSLSLPPHSSKSLYLDMEPTGLLIPIPQVWINPITCQRVQVS